MYLYMYKIPDDTSTLIWFQGHTLIYKDIEGQLFYSFKARIYASGPRSYPYIPYQSCGLLVTIYTIKPKQRISISLLVASSSPATFSRSCQGKANSSCVL